jgi:hypothetical protein
MVGTGRFELPTPRTPSECSTRLSHVPTGFELAFERGLTSRFYTSRYFRDMSARLTAKPVEIITLAMTPELQRALKSHMQWFGSYKKSGELKKIQVWLVVNNGRIEFLTPRESYKVKRQRRNSKAICYVGSQNGPAIAGTALIVEDRSDVARVYRSYWKTHPLLMAMGIGLRIWIGMLAGTRVVIRVEPDAPNPLAGLNDPA